MSYEIGEAMNGDPVFLDPPPSEEDAPHKTTRKEQKDCLYVGKLTAKHARLGMIDPDDVGTSKRDGPFCLHCGESLICKYVEDSGKHAPLKEMSSRDVRISKESGLSCALCGKPLKKS